LSWNAGEAAVDGDPSELGQALDNLIVNAIEHGGPEVVVAAEANRDGLRLAVIDAGRRSRPSRQGKLPAKLTGRLSGRRHRGHGLAVVRRTAFVHGGDFRLFVSALQTRAVLELPLALPARAA